ncbi:MAG: alanine racemase, partial [Acidobacteriota bacterium]
RPAVEREQQSLSGHSDPWIEVPLDHIVWNFEQVKKRVKVPIMAVVKANAYGHGLIEVSKTLQKAGADWLMVGKLQEAFTLREAGVACPILNFGPFDGRDGAEIISQNISQAVYTEDAALLDEAAARLKRKAAVHVDIDTGMGRTGVPTENALRLIDKIASFRNVTIEGVCTTLTEDSEFDREQLRRFLDLCSAAQNRGISLGLRHAASSSGVFYSSEFYLDMVRPGITLYGYYPSPQTREGDSLGLKPALRLAARIVFIKDLLAGETLSYHRVFKAQKDMRVATAGIGYSDGYPPQLGGKGWVAVRNKRFPVLNAVTANHAMIDLGDDREVKIGDEVRLIDYFAGSGLTADSLAEQGGISDYKILLGLSPLLPRVYSR